MATIYGCVTWPAGMITFENLEGCLIQDTCIIWTGDHAGQVALTLSGATNEDCNDTFYGCVNWTTGKFEVIIPDNCCIVYGNDCNWCDAGETPHQIEVTFSGISACGCYDAGGYSYKPVFLITPNSSFIATQKITNPCAWGLDDDLDYMKVDKYAGSGCSGSFISSSYIGGGVSVARRATTGFVLVHFSYFFVNDGEREPDYGCIGVYINPVPNNAVCGTYKASGGSAIISEI